MEMRFEMGEVKQDQIPAIRFPHEPRLDAKLCPRRELYCIDPGSTKLVPEWS